MSGIERDNDNRRIGRLLEVYDVLGKMEILEAQCHPQQAIGDTEWKALKAWMIKQRESLEIKQSQIS